MGNAFFTRLLQEEGEKLPQEEEEKKKIQDFVSEASEEAEEGQPEEPQADE